MTVLNSALAIGQTAVNLVPDAAQPGQLADLTYNEIESFPAAEVINPGRAVMIASDGLSVQQVQTSSSSTLPTTLLGVSVLNSAREGQGSYGITAYGQGGLPYQVGEMVPVLLRGRIYAEWSGTTQSAFSSPNVYSSSTVSTNRGKFTDATASAGAGTEVCTGIGHLKNRQVLPGSGNLILVDVNLPGVT